MKRILPFFRIFLSKAPNRRLSYLVVLILIALADAVSGGKERRTFVFYSLHDGKPAIETRMLHRPAGLEARVGQYVEEILLGPGSEGLGRLFDKESSLSSLLVRDSVAYVDLSPEAALPAEREMDVRRPLLVLREGILRNFPSLRKVVFFINGREPFPDDPVLTVISDDPAKKPKSVDK